jgi:hypothetical protein
VAATATPRSCRPPRWTGSPATPPWSPPSGRRPVADGLGQRRAADPGRVARPGDGTASCLHRRCTAPARRWGYRKGSTSDWWRLRWSPRSSPRRRRRPQLAGLLAITIIALAYEVRSGRGRGVAVTMRT